MDEHRQTWKNQIRVGGGNVGWTNMDEHGRTISEGAGDKVNEHGRTWTNMEEHGRTWTNLDEPDSGGRGWGGRTWTNMSEPYLRGVGEKANEHGRTWVNHIWVRGKRWKNMDEPRRTWTNMDEHKGTFGHTSAVKHNP